MCMFTYEKSEESYKMLDFLPVHKNNAGHLSFFISDTISSILCLLCLVGHKKVQFSFIRWGILPSFQIYKWFICFFWWNVGTFWIFYLDIPRVHEEMLATELSFLFLFTFFLQDEMYGVFCPVSGNVSIFFHQIENFI